MENSCVTHFEEVYERPSFPDEEEKILAYWKEIDAFKSSYQQSVDENRPLYTFYDGPPFATGLPHYGHILAGTIKDIVTRYAHQTGHCVSRRFGWDCHGLPIECEIDKKLNIQSRKQIEHEIGIDKYNDECRSIVDRYTSQWKVTMERVGRWIDFEKNYRTMDATFMESVWWAFKRLYTSGLVYRAAKVMPYSTACATPLSNFEANLNYKNVHDPSIVVVFPSRDDSTMELLAWTTTPWTLLSNCALCVNPDILYTRLHRVGHKNLDGQDIDWIISRGRVDWLINQLKLKLGVDVVLKGEPFLGSQLKDMHYYPPFDFYFSPIKQLHPELSSLRTNAFRVIVDTFATDTTGTGIVHCSPAFGEDDYRVCHENNIINKEEPCGVPCPINDHGILTDDVGEFKGCYIKDADKLVRENLKNKKKILVNNEEVHSYPFCWRTDTPLIYKILPSWFVRVESMRENLIKNNEETYWVPNTIKEKRFYNWLKDARDWCISRNRFWGTPIPLWVNEDFTQIVCIGSIQELQKYTKTPITDLHRHHIDSITIPDPRNSSTQTYPDLKRIDEVFDCWFESGCVPYAQIHYPFENEHVFRNGYPAHFVAEGLDQTRGWFYTMMVLSTALFNKAPFKNLIVNGLILASDGKKMSKRLKNYPEPETVIKEHGADALRLYLVNSPVVKAEPLRFSDRGVRDTVREVLLPWYHAYRFLIQMITSYEHVTGSCFTILETNSLANSSNIMDQWIFGSLQKLIVLVNEEMKSYRLYTVVPLLVRFLDQLTNWYVRLNRDRMRAGVSHNSNSNHCDTHHAINVLFAVIFDTLRLMCPFTPFICELMYKNLKKLLVNTSHYSASVHFLMMPEPNVEYIDDNIENMVKQMQRIIVCCRALREQKKVSLKTPLLSMTLVHLSKDEPKTLEPILHYLIEELNVLEIFIKPMDSNLIQMELIPNFKSLGARFGSQMPLWVKKLKSLSYEDIKNFQTTHALILDSAQFGIEDISIKYTLSSFSDQRQIVMDCIDNFVIMLDFTVNENVHQMSIAREIVNRIQKLRKQAKLSSSSQLRMNVALSNDLLDVFTAQKKYIERSLRRPVFLVSDIAEFLRCNVILFQECFSLNEKESIHVLFTDVETT